MVNSQRSARAPELGLAEPDARTRDRVLAVVSERGPITAAELAAALGLTAPGVRRHLDHLASEGAIEDRHPAATKRGRGRPAREWVVSEAGHDALTSGYDALATEAMRFLRDAAGDSAVQRFAESRVAQVEQRYERELAEVGDDPRDRADALVEILRRDGYAASARPVGAGGRAGVQLCQGHCPVQHVAAEHPELCEAETEAFSRLLGVHVQRLATLAQGDHVCTTFVPTPDPRTSTDLPSSTDLLSSTERPSR